MAAKALYSPSAVDLATVGCFLVFHEISALLKKMQYPVKHFLVSKHEPQSKSENATNCKELLEGKNNPSEGLPLRYLNTCSAACQCTSLGACTN